MQIQQQLFSLEVLRLVYSKRKNSLTHSSRIAILFISTLNESMASQAASAIERIPVGRSTSSVQAITCRSPWNFCTGSTFLDLSVIQIQMSKGTSVRFLAPTEMYTPLAEIGSIYAELDVSDGPSFGNGTDGSLWKSLILAKASSFIHQHKWNFVSQLLIDSSTG